MMELRLVFVTVLFPLLLLSYTIPTHMQIMGSEGYLINQFLTKRTNRRTDEFGGSYENRMRFATEIVRQTRAAVGPDFVIIYRLSMLDLVSDGSSWPEVVELAQRIELNGASIINTGIGWHEARVPTIGTMVPRGAFTWVTEKMKQTGGLKIPLCTTNRINTPETAESVLSAGHSDLISMARCAVPLAPVDVASLIIYVSLTCARTLLQAIFGGS